MNRLQAPGTRPVLGLGQSRRPARSVADHPRTADAPPAVHVRDARCAGARRGAAGSPADLLRGRAPGLRLPRGRLSIRVRGRRSRPGRRRSVALAATGDPPPNARRRHEVACPRGAGAASPARPFVYNLEHGVTYLALDLDELDGIENAASLIRRNRRGLLEIRDVDHLDPPAEDLRAAVHDHLRAAGEDPAGWQVTLVTNPRVLGYVFNPASFYLCRDPEGVLRIVIVEVHNTHGERHLYTLRPRPGGDVRRRDGQGLLRVAVPRDARRVHRPGARRADPPADHDQPRGSRGAAAPHKPRPRRRPLTARSVVRMLVRYPLVTHRTTLMIHWHALRLWLRGARFHRHREAAR